MKLLLMDIEDAGVVRVDAEGPVTAADFSTPSVEPFETVLGQKWSSKKVLLSFQRVSHVDSNGVGWLMQSNKAIKTAGGKLIVYGLQPLVRQVFDLLKVGRIVAVADTLEAARELLVEKQG